MTAFDIHFISILLDMISLLREEISASLLPADSIEHTVRTLYTFIHIKTAGILYTHKDSKIAKCCLIWKIMGLAHAGRTTKQAAGICIERWNSFKLSVLCTFMRNQCRRHTGKNIQRVFNTQMETFIKALSITFCISICQLLFAETEFYERHFFPLCIFYLLRTFDMQNSVVSLFNDAFNGIVLRLMHT